MFKSLKKGLILISGILFLSILSSCMSAGDLYRYNYSDDPVMQDRMEKEYGDPFRKN